MPHNLVVIMSGTISAAAKQEGRLNSKAELHHNPHVVVAMACLMWQHRHARFLEHCIDWRNVMRSDHLTSDSEADLIATVVDELVSEQISDLSREDIDQVVGGYFEADEVA